MIHASVLLHANLLYAEIPIRSIETVVENSYMPILELLKRRPGYRAVLNFSGFTLELLSGEHPEIYRGSPEALDLLRDCIAGGKVELTGTSWSHAILPLMPDWLQEMDVALCARTIFRLLEYRPVGFFPPELGISPLLPAMLGNAGYRWSFFDRDFLAMTEGGQLNAFNDFEPIPPSFTKRTAEVKQRGLIPRLRHMAGIMRHLRESRDFSPIDWIGAGGGRIAAYGCDTAWTSYALICLSRQALLSEKRLIGTIRRILRSPVRGLFIPYSSDIEFYGFGGNTIKDPIPVSRLETLMDALCGDPRLELTLPTEYLEKTDSPLNASYLKAGSWSSDRNFDLWEREPDNRILNRQSGEASELYRRRLKGMSPEEDLDLLKSLLLSYNSDGRGWTPLPEHRLFCLDKALEVKRRLAGREGGGSL